MKAWQTSLTSLSLFPLDQNQTRLATPIGITREAFLKVCSKGQKFQNARRYRWVKTQATLNGPMARVHLHAVSAINLHFPFVHQARNPERNQTLCSSMRSIFLVVHNPGFFVRTG